MGLLEHIAENTTTLYQLAPNAFVLVKGVESMHVNREALERFIQRKDELYLALDEMLSQKHNTAEFGGNGFFTLSYNSDITVLLKGRQ